MVDQARRFTHLELENARPKRLLGKVGVKTLYIEPGSHWENAEVDSLNGNCVTSCSTGRSSTQ
jgi:hypothetical protein